MLVRAAVALQNVGPSRWRELRRVCFEAPKGVVIAWASGAVPDKDSVGVGVEWPFEPGKSGTRRPGMRKELLMMVCALAVAALLPTSATLPDPPEGLILHLERSWDGDRIAVYDDGECLVYSWPSSDVVRIRTGRATARRLYARLEEVDWRGAWACHEDEPRSDWFVQLIDQRNTFRSGNLCLGGEARPVTRLLQQELRPVWEVLRHLHSLRGVPSAAGLLQAAPFWGAGCAPQTPARH